MLQWHQTDSSPAHSVPVFGSMSQLRHLPLFGMPVPTSSCEGSCTSFKMQHDCYLLEEPPRFVSLCQLRFPSLKLPLYLVHMELPESLAFCIQALMVLLAKYLWQGCNLHTPTEWPCSLAHSRPSVEFCSTNYLWSLTEPSQLDSSWMVASRTEPVCAGKDPIRWGPLSNGAITKFDNHACLFLDGHTHQSVAKPDISLTFSCICWPASPSSSPSVQFAFPTTVEKLPFAYLSSSSQFIEAFGHWSFLPWCWCHCQELWATLCPSVWATD